MEANVDQRVIPAIIQASPEYSVLSRVVKHPAKCEIHESWSTNKNGYCARYYRCTERDTSRCVAKHERGLTKCRAEGRRSRTLSSTNAAVKLSRSTDCSPSAPSDNEIIALAARIGVSVHDVIDVALYVGFQRLRGLSVQQVIEFLGR
jgi:hypothetical protein